uniref:Uncharacterized protein n=1 Tax=Octopus bimaculoides TaxID=37653 RepID=A0A0L8IHQ9_OCTBM
MQIYTYLKKRQLAMWCAIFHMTQAVKLRYIKTHINIFTFKLRYGHIYPFTGNAISQMYV